MSAFSETRNIELSSIYYLETQIGISWTGITVVKTFLSAYDNTLPVVCIRLYDTSNKPLEVGSTTLLDTHRINIDIFATSDGQRIDLADFITDKLKDGWIYYTHSHPVGDNTTLTRTSAGRISVKDWNTNTRVDFGDEVSNPDKFRHFIQVGVKAGII